MNKKLKELLKRSLCVTQSLYEEANTYNTKFLNVLLGVYRVSFITLRDIYYLSSCKETGSSMLDLARKIIEHGIMVEYMIMKGKEKMAKKFQDYLLVQLHDEKEFLKSIRQKPTDFSEELKIRIKEKEYNDLNQKIKKNKTWAGVNIDEMLKCLYDKQVIREFDFSRLDLAYIWGSRLNHPNPFVTRGYLTQQDQEVNNEFYSNLAMLVAIAIHLRLTTRFIDEKRIWSKKNIHQDLVDKVSAICRDIDSLESLK